MALASVSLKILFVGDNLDLIKTASRTLERLGHSVTIETESLNGLRTFSENPDYFDLAILDPTMAHISGFELAQRFRRIQPGFPVILYGGNIDPSLSRDAEQAGVCCCDKPATVSELDRAIREALKR